MYTVPYMIEMRQLRHAHFSHVAANAISFPMSPNPLVTQLCVCDHTPFKTDACTCPTAIRGGTSSKPTQETQEKAGRQLLDAEIPKSCNDQRFARTTASTATQQLVGPAKLRNVLYVHLTHQNPPSPIGTLLYRARLPSALPRGITVLGRRREAPFD